MRKVTIMAIISLILLISTALMGTTLLNSAVEEKDIEVPEDVLGESIDEYTVELANGKYKASWFEANPARLSLISNFSQKDQAGKLASRYECISAINAGFYDTDDTPLGLFIADGATVEGFRENKIMNGILSVNSVDIPRISPTVPRDPLRIAVQTGPLLIHNASFITLNTSTDKQSRRMIAFTTGENRLYFLALYTPTSTFRGPLMSELQELLTEFGDKSGISIADAINLDGGSASYFSSDGFTLSEISPIGALFCSK